MDYKNIENKELLRDKISELLADYQALFNGYIDNEYINKAIFTVIKLK